MRQTERKLPHFLSQKEIDSFLKPIRKPRHRLGFILMAYAGLRVSEVCTLKVGDINLSRGFLKVKGKGNKERIVPLNAKAQSMVENYLRQCGAGLEQENCIVGGARSSWHDICKRYARHALGRSDIHCHTLRHSFATNLYEEGVQIERIGQLLGHSRLDTTMIYAHISVEQKREAVTVLDNPGYRLVRKITTIHRTITELTVTPWHEREKDGDPLIGRATDRKAVADYLARDISVLVYGEKGVGKSALLRSLYSASETSSPDPFSSEEKGSKDEEAHSSNLPSPSGRRAGDEGSFTGQSPIFIPEFRKKQSLITILLDAQHVTDPDMRKELEREMKKQTNEELLAEIKEHHPSVIIDDLTGLSRTDRTLISKLSAVTRVVAASSRPADRKLFATYHDLKPLPRYQTRQILSGMIRMTDPDRKERVVDEILHTAGDNLKEAEYIARQMQLGKAPEEIQSDERTSQQTSIAPVLTIVLLFFVAWVLKSYATSMVAFSYAVLVVFRMIFYRYIFTPAISKRK